METVGEMVAAIRARRVSPVELVERALERAEAWQPVTNAFSQVHAEEALAEAAERGDAVAAGEPLGALHGVPVAVKDLFDVAGWETTGCCAAYRGRVAGADADAVRRLRRAGAVIVGKTNQHELAAGATNLISACGPTRNPWDRSRITGGSSGGSGAAVAARVVPLALGTDTGGSVRIPGSLCGVAGLKPTTGRTSIEGVMPLAPSLDTVGPMAATVEDVARAFAVLAGEHAVGDLPAEGIAGVRVGVLGGMFEAAARDDQVRARDGVADALADVGAAVATVRGELPYEPEDWDRVAWTELYEAHGHVLRDAADAIHPWTRAFMERGRSWTGEPYREARRRHRELRAAFLDILEEADVLLAPATPAPATLPGEREIALGSGQVIDVRRGAISLLTRPINMAGLPALVLPAGFSPDGLPLAVQLVGRPDEEALVLRVGAAYQGVTGHHERVPTARGGS